MSRIKSPIDVAMRDNNATFIDFLDRLRLLATSIFSWTNLDKLCGDGAERFMEQNLYEYGRAVVVKDEELGCLALRVNPADTYNVYYMPTKIMAWSIGYEKQYNLEDVVYVMNNELQKPTIETAMLFAYRLYEAERVTDVNLNAQKTPVLIEGDTKTILTLKQVYEQYSGNTPFIFGNKQYDLSNALNVLNTGAPYIVDKVYQHKKSLLNDYINFLGIKSFSTEKKERLVGEEAKGNEELSTFYLNCFYKTRQKAVDEINEKFKPKELIKLEANIKEIDKFKQTLEELLEEKEVKNDIMESSDGKVYDDDQASN